MLEHSGTDSLDRWFGRDAATTGRFLRLAVVTFVLTVVLSAIGQQLLASWTTVHAHLLIESVAVVLFLGTVGATIANAYFNDGVCISIALALAPVIGFGGFIVLDTVFNGGRLTLASLASLVLAAGAIGIGGYLFGIVLRAMVIERRRNDLFIES